MPSPSDAPPPTFGDIRIRPQSDRVRLFAAACGDDTPATFADLMLDLSARLQAAPVINRGKWQTLNTTDSPAHATKELRNVCLSIGVTPTILEWKDEVMPDLPWADDHFRERVGREPVNPPPSHVNWPWHGSDKERHLDDGHIFSHTYPERFWPKWAGEDDRGEPRNRPGGWCNRGIRFTYGDLDDVVQQLVKQPLTRQAVLPVWFPEDTGHTDQRVPCTLYYHFMADEDNNLSVWYSLRACDFVRHFRNDVYFAGRLLQWVCDEVAARSEFAVGFMPRDLNMTISSLHAHVGDLWRLTP